MSRMVTSEENMSNLRNAETIVTVGDSETITGTKCGNWHQYHKHDGKLYCAMFSNTTELPRIHSIYLL